MVQVNWGNKIKGVQNKQQTGEEGKRDWARFL